VASAALDEAATAERPALVIVVSTVRAPGRFEARLAGTDNLLVASSRQPLVDAARVLIAHGHDPGAAVVMKHRGSDTVALSARLGIAAGLAVDEAGRPRFTRWMPFFRGAVSLGIAPSDQTATLPAPAETLAARPSPQSARSALNDHHEIIPRQDNSAGVQRVQRRAIRLVL
jgi:hypothetical protein